MTPRFLLLALAILEACWVSVPQPEMPAAVDYSVAMRELGVRSPRVRLTLDDGRIVRGRIVDRRGRTVIVDEHGSMASFPGDRIRRFQRWNVGGVRAGSVAGVLFGGVVVGSAATMAVGVHMIRSTIDDIEAAIELPEGFSYP